MPRLVAVSLFVAVAMVARVAFACDCLRLPELSSAVATESRVIFSGQALEVVERTEHTTRTTWGGGSGEVRFVEKWVAFRVIDAWRGVDRDTVLVAVDNSDCAFAFEPGESYLVFADRRGSGKPFTNACMRTTRIAGAGPIIAKLGPGRSASARRPAR